MSRKKKQAAPENHERWLVSYADFITLLFAFFVVMFASSNQDKAKAQQVSESVRKALDGGHVAAKVAAVLGGTVNESGQGNAQRKGPGGARKAAQEDSPPPQPEAVELAPSMDFLNRELEAEIRAGRLMLKLEARGLVVTLPQATYFPSGQDVIDPVTFPVIAKLAQVIQKLPNQVRLEGHTDSVPIHNARFRSNWDLSAARSIAMLELLATRYGVPRERLAIAGYADNFPATSNQTAEGRARNRRVDLVIVNRAGLAAEPVAAAQPKKAGAGAHRP
ncbi:MAG TPA: flagellar motor protein MotB [Bryobacteraceae bacterium]|nr:flagellar motor protein MotB [Bryobacteraceae bacterium]